MIGHTLCVAGFLVLELIVDTLQLVGEFESLSVTLAGNTELSVLVLSKREKNKHEQENSKVNAFLQHPRHVGVLNQALIHPSQESIQRHWIR